MGEPATEGLPGGTGAAAGRQAGPRHDQLHPRARRKHTGAVRRPAVQQRGAAAAPGYPQVVKVFNNITSWHLGSLARPAGTADRSALPLAGDDPAAKAAVTRFLDGIGYDAVDAGPLGSGGRRFQFGTPAFVSPYGGLGDERGTPAGVAAIPRRCAPVTPNPVPQIDAGYRIPLAASAVCPSRSSHGFASKRSNTSRASCRSGGASSARPSRTSHSPCSRSVTAM